MLRDSLIMNTKKISNWAGSVKDCLESCGFQDVWTSGRVDNEKAFLSSVKQRMIERFKQEWNANISDSDRFSTYDSFKSVYQLETFLNTITIKKFRDALIRLRLGWIELGVHTRFKCDSFVNKNCSFCPNILDDEPHFLFCCPAYADIRRKYLWEINIHCTTPSLSSVFENPRTVLLRKLAMFAFYALKHREELLAQWIYVRKCLYIICRVLLDDCYVCVFYYRESMFLLLHPPIPPQLFHPNIFGM